MIRNAIAAASAAILLTCAPAGPQVNTPADSRWVVHNAGEFSQSSVSESDCHPLEYFVNTPKNAAHYTDQVGRDSGTGNDAVQSLRIGEIHGFTIYSIIDNIAVSESNPTYIKMIVVERKPSDFCKIYEDVGDRTIMYDVNPPRIEDFGPEKLLISQDRVSGTGGILKEMYWTFDDDGPIPFDLSVAEDALQNIKLPQVSNWEGTAINLSGLFAFSQGFDLATLTYKSPVFCLNTDKPPVSYQQDGNPCNPDGSITVTFALKDHQLAIVDQKYVAPTLRPIRVSEEEQTAKLIERVPPICPPEERQACAQGDGVIVGAVIGTDGKVVQASAGSGRTALFEAAVEAVRQWRYMPTLIAGKPVEVVTSVSLKFSQDQ